MIYADHAATTPLCEAAWEAMVPFLRQEFGNPSSLHAFARRPREAVREARQTIAACLNAAPEEIFFTSGGTEADNWVIQGAEGTLGVSAYEHHAVLNAAMAEADRGRECILIRPHRDGTVMPDRLSALRGGPGLISVMTANNELGVLNPIAELCGCAHRKGFLFHTDAVQAVGHVRLDVRETDVDFLSASAHKFNGPKGIGFLYARRGTRLVTLLHGGQQEQGRRAGTENVAAIVGMAAALKWNCERLEEHTAKLCELGRRLEDGITGLFPDAQVLGVESPRLPGLAAVSLPGHPAEELLHLLDLKGIAVSSGAACDSRRTQVSHVLKAIRLPARLARCTLRFSLGVENTHEEVNRIVDALRSLTS